MAKEADQDNLPHLCLQPNSKAMGLEEYRCVWQGISSGRESSNKNFEKWVDKLDRFDLNCVGCCWLYLVTERNYLPVTGAFEDNRVEFRHGETTPLAQTLMFLDRHRKEGLVKVDKLTRNANRTVDQGYTYQFYNNDGEVNSVPTELSMRTLLPVRLETIQVNVPKAGLTAEQLRQCYFHYYDAALLELWRESKHQESLEGTIFYSNNFPALKKEPNDDVPMLTHEACWESVEKMECAD